MKATNLLPFLFAFFFVNSLFSQSNIQQSLSVNSSGSAADASAQLDVSATDKGMLVPRMTTAQRTAIASPATGLLVFDTTTGGFWFYNGTVWADLSAPKTLADADADTKIQVEKNPDEDIIRFDLAGTESMVLRKNVNGRTRLELYDGFDNTVVGTTAMFFNEVGAQNTAVGNFALVENTTGNKNTAIGLSAMDSNSTGSNNTGIGANALNSNATGSNNTALGVDADVTTFNLSNATAIGYKAKAGSSNSLILGGTGANSVRVGVGTTTPAASALLDLTATDKGMLVPRMTSAQRTAIASPATGLLVFDTTTGGFWVYNGTTWVEISKTYTAGAGISVVGTTITNTGDVNAADDITTATAAGGDLSGTYPNPTVGANAIGSAEITNASIAVADLNFGTAAANQVLTATSPTTAAWQAPAVQKILADADNDTKIQVEEAADEDVIRFDLAGTENMVLRKSAGGSPRLELPNAQSNTYVGVDAGSANTFGINNTATGFQALKSTTTGFSNTATGFTALNSNLTGHSNTANGNQALNTNTTGYENTANGNQALYSNTTGFDNTANGSFALSSNNTGSFNTATGFNALLSNTTGFGNTANGTSALYSNTIGFGNTANGTSALYSNTTGNFNTANGQEALGNNQSGSNNTSIGYKALSINTGGSFNTCLGDRADVSTNNLDGASSLGTQAIANASNKIVLGANVGGIVIGGYTFWSNLSDGRFKENIKEDVPGLAFINQLRPVTYSINTDKLQRHITAQMPDSIAQRYLPTAELAAKDMAEVHTGFVAQEVEAAARSIGYAFDGVNAPKNPTDNYSIGYSQFVPSLVKAVQELADRAGRQQKEIEQLRKLEIENTALKAQLAAQASQLDKITASLQGAGIAVEK